MSAIRRASEIMTCETLIHRYYESSLYAFPLVEVWRSTFFVRNFARNGPELGMKKPQKSAVCARWQ